jgi:hypothetical protein
MADKSYNGLAEIYRQCDAKAVIETDELFGGAGDEQSDEELKIIFSDLSHTDKMARLKVLRGESVKPKSFRRRLTEGDFLQRSCPGHLP